jgi:hypothetical protein
VCPGIEIELLENELLLFVVEALVLGVSWHLKRGGWGAWISSGRWWSDDAELGEQFGVAWLSSLAQNIIVPLASACVRCGDWRVWAWWRAGEGTTLLLSMSIDELDLYSSDMRDQIAPGASMESLSWPCPRQRACSGLVVVLSCQ